ncbi:MAG: hypothetical protein RIF37_00585 [Rhodospirillaceae bacterium]
MVDTPTLRNRLRKQELGTNTNTWGDDKLNEVIDAIDQALDGVAAIALTGDKVLSSSNYTLADESLNRVLKFTGTLTSAVMVTLPSVEHWYLVVNTAGAQVTIKTAAGSGVAVEHGSSALVYCDGADVLNGAPTTLGGATRIAGGLSVAGKISGVTAGAAASDAVNKTQLDAAIAGATVAGATGTVKVDATATAQFLIDALTVGGSPLTDNGDSLDIPSEPLGLADGGDKASDFTAAANTKYTVECTSAVTVTLPATPGKGDLIVLGKYGSGVLSVGLNALNYYGSVTGPATAAQGVIVLQYTNAVTGWIDL